MSIVKGDVLTVRDAAGRELRKRALGPEEHGVHFPIVWACSEEEWTAAAAEGRDPIFMAWPAEDVERVGA